MNIVLLTVHEIYFSMQFMSFIAW